MLRIKHVVLVTLAAMGLALLGCSSPTPNASSNPLPTPTNTPLPLPTNTPLPPPTSTPLPPPTQTPTPVPTPTLAPQSLELTVLHTNDTIGYTDPCG
jgi:hypothetical protein